ncbi:MAG: hypothetical protein V5A43_06640, partial [Haloarculaceae archaeon]
MDARTPEAVGRIAVAAGEAILGYDLSGIHRYGGRMAASLRWCGATSSNRCSASGPNTLGSLSGAGTDTATATSQNALGPVPRGTTGVTATSQNALGPVARASSLRSSALAALGPAVLTSLPRATGPRPFIPPGQHPHL